MKPIYVTQPLLPPLEEFVPYLEKIWAARILTNCGPMHQQLEGALAQYLGVPHVALFNNGTNALLTALQALELAGEVITTPYSFAATAHSILWNGLTPVFVDVDPHTFNLDPRSIEAAISPRTSAILPVHCYGYPCDVAAIADVASRHGLKVLYDAAHAFGVRLQGASVLLHGDLSVLSFHATKVFNTFEGGAIVCHDAATKRRIERLRNFGIVDEATIDAPGLNGKMSEVQAAFGLLQLKYVDAAIVRRRSIAQRYRQLLADVPGIELPAAPAAAVELNGSYFPVLVGPAYPLDRDSLYQRLQQRQVFARRYFFPLLSELPMYRELPSAAAANLPQAHRLAGQVLCLPLYAALSDADVELIADTLRG
jgi:dTDP-4-amino-4,6-dideoxygalactose transaminase